MKKLRKSLIVLGLASTAICGISLSISKNNLSEVNAEQHVENFELYDYENYSGTYYDFLGTDTLTNGLNGTLRTKLSSNILPKDWYSYSGSGEKTLSSILQQADEDPSNHDNMVFLYTRDSVKKQPAGTWNREHTWPKNLSGGNWGEGKAGTDILHLRPTYQTPNSTRSNNKFAEISGGQKRTYNGMDFGYTSGSNFMPLDAVKGDVARIIMYVWVAYKDYYSSMPNITNVFESYDTLLKWHTQDKPDLMEAHRNDVAEDSYQKNRNPFVDHPEYAWKIFGDSASASVKNACIAAYPDSPTPTKTLSEIEVSGTPTKTTYVAGESFDLTGLTVTAIYSDGTNKDVTNDVSISPNPLTVGTTSVTLSYTDGVTKSETVSGITVNAPVIPVQSISILNSEFNYTVGSTCELEVGFNPSNASDKSLSYFSSNTSIAKVDNDGIVSFLKAGEVDITVTSGNGKTDVAHFVVSDEVIEVSEVKLTESTVSLKVGETKELEYTVLPVNATDKSVVWSSSNKEVATVSNEGKVTALKAGTTTIKVSTPDGSFFDDCVITITEEPKPVRTLVEIVVSKNPDKTTYALNEKYDESGLIIEAHYLDGTSEDVTKQCTSNKDQISTSTAGKKSIFYSYESLSLFVPIYVVNDEVTELKITKNPVKLNYFKSEEFSTIGLEVKAVIGGSEVGVTDMIQIECDFEKSNLVTIKFGGLSKEIEVTLESGTITEEHKAVDYTYVFEDKLSDTTKETMTLDSWKVLEYYYNSLDDATKEVLKKVVTAYGNGEVSAAEGNVEKLKECISDYDEIYLLHKADGFNDFMNRSPKTPAPNPNSGIGDTLRKIAIIAGIVIGIIVVIILIIVISVSASKKGKKKHA